MLGIALVKGTKELLYPCVPCEDMVKRCFVGEEPSSDTQLVGNPS